MQQKIEEVFKAAIFQSEFWLRTPWPGQDFIAPVVGTASVMSQIFLIIKNVLHLLPFKM